MNFPFFFKIFDKENRCYLPDDKSIRIQKGEVYFKYRLEGEIKLDEKRFVLLTSTGFRDKNDNLVYTGDILDDGRGNHPHIYYSRGKGCFMLDYGDEKEPVQADMSLIADMKVEYNMVDRRKTI